MCDCENGINSCESNTNVSCNEVANTKVIPTYTTVQDAQNTYISGLLGDITKLQADLETEKRNCNRFQQLYTCLLGYTMKCLNEKDINVFDEAVKKLAEIEMNS